VGFNKKKKGARNDYPLYYTVAQTDQVFDFHHRTGNVHDSNGAETFMVDCFQQIGVNLSARTLIEARMDSAFFSEKVVMRLDDENVEFTQSVPFERFPALKNCVNDNQDWAEYDDEYRFVELELETRNREVHSFSIYRGQKKSEKSNHKNRYNWTCSCRMITRMNTP